MLSRLFFDDERSEQKNLKRKARPLGNEKLSKSRKTKRLRKAEQEEEPVDSVHETDAAHWKRHGSETASQNYCRCNYIRNKAELHRGHPWLTPRPSFMDGPWRLGCDCCSWMSSNSQQEKHVGRRGGKVRSSVFANFNLVYNGFNRALQNRIQAHSETTGHKAAIRAAHRCSKALPAYISSDFMSRPSATMGRPLATMSELIAESSSEVLNDSLFKSRAPQCEDWLDAWADATEQISFHKQDRCVRKKSTFNYRKKT